VILLDTNALIWLATAHPRAKPLQEASTPLRLSPVSLLELCFLEEVGRLQIAPGRALPDLAASIGVPLDSPTSAELFQAAVGVSWTRDPFDRLLVAHAHCRSWPIATGDRNLLAHLPAEAVFPL
jgi:PIN domain nuclease of toxin-antitoxin system